MAGGGPKSPTPWGRRARRGCRGVVRCRGAAVWGRAGARPGAAQGCSVGLRRGGGGTACTLGGGGGCGLVGGCAREGDGGAVSSAAERHRAADRAKERLGLAKVGRGARGARGVGGAAVSGGARTPLGGEESRRPSSTGANPGGGRGGAPHRPLAAEPDRDGPRRRDTGGAGGAGHQGSGARVPGSCGPARGRPGGRLGCGWRGGRGRAGRARGRTPRGPRGLGEGSRGRPFLEGGGGCYLLGLHGALKGRGAGPRRGAAAWDCAGA